MKYSAFAFIIGVVTLVGCSNKETVEKPINGVYPHLLKIEKEFVNELNKLDQKHDVKSEKEKVSVKKKIFDLIAKDTTTLSHEFGPLLDNEEFNIVTSPDKNLRIYVTTCNTEMGTSMNLIQYRDNTGIIHVINAEQWKKQIENTTKADQNLLFEHWIHKIHEFLCKDGTNLYVITSDENLNGEISNHSITYTLATYKINNKILEPIESFVSEDKTTQNIVRVFNYSYLWYYPDEQHHEFAEVDSISHILYVGNEVDNEPIDRYQCFQFNGTNLTDIGESAPFWLCHSLHEFKRIVYLCTSQSQNIRIDDMGKGVCRYASWPRDRMFSDEPSIVIFGRKIRITDKEGLVNHALSFTKDGNEYRVLLHPGRWGFYASEVEIYNNGNVIQKIDVE